jgi:23S rRNA pseudouridine1911/1915/1917 synthase
MPESAEASQREPDLVAPGDGRSLGVLLAARLGSEGERLIRQGAVWVDGVRVREPGSVPAAGAAIRVRRPPPQPAGGRASGEPRIIYEDESLIAVDKPPGAYVDATPWDADNHVRGAVARLLAARDQQAPQLHLVHRLDRDTSGVLLLSKDPAVNPALQRAFVEQQVHKTYVALCAGAPPAGEIVVESGHGRGRYGMLRVYPASAVGQRLPGGATIKRMRTRLVVARRLADAALLWAYPASGRTHQIRLHAALIGCPLVGDTRYGGPAIWQGAFVPAHRLHAARLELPHPRSGQPLVIEATMPAWVQ